MQNYGYQGYGYPTNYQQPNYMQRGYAPQPVQMPQNQAQTFMPIQTPPTIETPIQDIKFVTRAQAEAYIVFPNTKVMLIDNENAMVYLKTADGMGQTKTDYFSFERVNPDGTPIKNQEPAPKVDFNNFVKREDLQSLGFVTIDEHNKVIAELDAIKKALAPKPQMTKGGTQQ